MKKILFVALGATLLAAGCQKTEIINPVNPTGQPALTFTTDLSKLTKAVGTADADADGMVNLKAQDFRVWAYADYEDPNTTTTELDKIYDKMANLNIGYSEKDVTTDEGTTKVGSWAPAKEYYWPGVGKDLRFFAVSGVNLGEDLSATDVVVPTITRTAAIEDDPATTDKNEAQEASVAMKLEVKDFVVNHAAPNADLMVADFVHQNQTNKEVALKFRHALAKVEFLFNTLDGSDATVYVQSLKVEKVLTKSTLTVTENAGEDKATKPTVFTWATPTIEQTFEDDYKDEANVPDDTELLSTSKSLDKTARELTTEAKNFCTWLVMPQSISTLQVKITYVIGKRQFESIFPLAATNLTAWGPNQYVRYTITLAPNKISFNPSVEEWDQFDADTTENGKQDINMQN
jgi:hypothetical protein